MCTVMAGGTTLYPELAMFDTLLETRALGERHLNGQAVSIVVHALIITAAVAATSRAVKPAPAEARRDFVLAVPIEPPPTVERQPAITPPPVPRGFQLLETVIDIPNVLPAIDLAHPVTDASNYTGVGIAGGTADGERTGVPRLVGQGSTYLTSDVDKPALLLSGAPAYPEQLKGAGLDGDVRATFVVDTLGRADLSTLTIVQSTHPMFASAVRKALPAMKFLPAEVAGRKVRVQVELPFTFRIK
jgi:protein TonB